MVSFADLITWFTGPVTPAAGTDIAAAFLLLSGFFSYILSTVIGRKGYVRYRLESVFAVGLISIAQGVTWVGDSLLPGSPDTGGLVFRIGVILSFGTWAFTFYILYHLAMLELARFKDPKRVLSLPGSAINWGTSCIDECLKVPANKSPPDLLHYPVVVVADEQYRPWYICYRFALAGLLNKEVKEGVIYFAFNRPATNVLRGLSAEYRNFLDNKEYKETFQIPKDESYSQTKMTDLLQNLVLIDCHFKWTSKGGIKGTESVPEDAGTQPKGDSEKIWAEIRGDLFNEKRLRNGDPRDPVELGKLYYKALTKLKNENDVKRVRVVYDSISDFLCYSDAQLAVQFLKHNMVWEDDRVAALYTYVPGVPASGFLSQADQRFLEWMANATIEFQPDADGVDWMVVTGLFSDKRGARVKRFEHEHEYKLLDPHEFDSAILPQTTASATKS